MIIVVSPDMLFRGLLINPKNLLETLTVIYVECLGAVDFLYPAWY